MVLNIEHKQLQEEVCSQPTEFQQAFPEKEDSAKRIVEFLACRIPH